MLSQQARIKLNSHCRCQHRPSSRPSAIQSSDLITAVASVLVWILIPKCPVCLAAHVAVWTGLGLTFSQAAFARGALMGCSGVILAVLVLKYVSRSPRGFPSRLSR